MRSARWGAFTVLLLLLIAAATIARRHSPSVREGAKPRLALLTSLPIIFGEQFSLTNSGSPALTALAARFRVIPLSTTRTSQLAKARLLVMAQPPAQTAENLVALDDWVRRGGRVLLLADPLLEWPSKRPLGDPLRPLPMFADTGLLMHWGLRLDAPDGRGPAERILAGYRIITVSPGSLYGGCAISADRLVADCRVGKGWAIVVADADFLNVAALGAQASDNLRALSRELAEMANR